MSEARAEPFAARFVTPEAQDAPVRARWRYRVSDGSDSALVLHEGDDAVAAAPDAAAAVELLQRRVLGRAVDHFARWGWLVLAGSVEAVDDRRTLTIGRGDGSLTLVRGGEAIPLPVPLPFHDALPGRGPLTELVVVGAPPGPLDTPGAMSALVAATAAPLPGGPRAAVREVTAALRGVGARGVPTA